MKAIRPKERILEAHAVTTGATWLSFFFFNALIGLGMFLWLFEELPALFKFLGVFIGISFILAAWNQKLIRAHKQWSLELLKVVKKEAHRVLLENRDPTEREHKTFYIVIEKDIRIQAPPGTLNNSWSNNVAGYFTDVAEHMKKRPKQPFLSRPDLSFNVSQEIKPLSAHQRLAAIKKKTSS
jgi:hypothetical protein